ncbi:MAG: hypothetical protein GX575_06945 [Candidatus Anammoximicrobium sp.]|nr:hypothetical protein [Candidatus Anammoximicrobium sp.]
MKIGGADYRRWLSVLGVPDGPMTCHTAWAVAIAIAVRRAGESLDTAKAVLAVLSNMPPQVVADAMSEGRSCVFVVNGNVCPRLTSRSAYTSDYMNELRAAAEESGIVATSRLVDTFPVYAKLQSIKEGSGKAGRPNIALQRARIARRVEDARNAYPNN